MAERGLPPLNWLRAFEAAARHLSFTAAAAELNMTQPAVSQHIKNLEHYLGRGLFVREARALQLTDAGVTYLPTVQDAFATLVKGTRTLTGIDSGARLDVQCNMAFSIFWLAPRMSDLLAKHPWLTLNVSTVTHDPERTAPAFKVEVRFGRAVDEVAAAISLGRQTAFPVARPDLIGSDWRETPLFDCPGISADWQAWLDAQGERLPHDRLVNLGLTYVFSMTAAMNGAGLAMSHDMLARGPIADGRLARLNDASIPLQEAYYLLRPPKRAETPATQAFCEWVLEQTGAERERDSGG